jgi:hypothetical protein
MTRKKRGQPPQTTWAYGYKIVPPQAEDRLNAIKMLLNHEHADAKRGARTWAGRVVLEEQVTHILVVSDSPKQNREVNRRLEAELKALKVGFSMTTPMAVADAGAPSPETARPAQAAS